MTVPRLSGSNTKVMVRLDNADATGGVTAAAVDAGDVFSDASLCTVSMTCCIGDKVGLGTSVDSTVTDLMIGASSDADAASFAEEGEVSSDGAAVSPSWGSAAPDKSLVADDAGALGTVGGTTEPAPAEGLGVDARPDCVVAAGKATAAEGAACACAPAVGSI